MIVAAIVGAVVLAGAGLVVAGVFLGRHDRGGPVPSFPSLQQHPDSSVVGTVAYFDDASRCVRIIAASGRTSQQVWCLPPEGADTWAKVGKPVGPQLVWRPDGRLEVTMFRMRPDPNTKQRPPLTRGWQKIIDVRSGGVVSVPDAQVPTTPDSSTQQTVNGRGETIHVEFDASSGKARITVQSQAKTRTVLSVQGPGGYGYRFGPAFWSPDGSWIAATDDSRILVIVPKDPAVTRVLVTGTGEGAGGGTAGPTFAVTSTDLLGTPG